MSPSLNLYIVEDSVLIQNRLVGFMDDLPDVHIVGVAGDIKSAYQEILGSDTNAMILDVQLSDGNGLSLLKSVKQKKPDVKIIVLTNHATDANRLQAMRAGADGFLDKSTDFAQIPRILHNWIHAEPSKNLN
ncbi:response regulator [Undibacterium sp. Rencai35W]|uniref:response regulator n=1 Tax=Undibacterium sp. Rencai35W TaxID=3413046 RepID=UPI003BF3C476